MRKEVLEGKQCQEHRNVIVKVFTGVFIELKGYFGIDQSNCLKMDTN